VRKLKRVTLKEEFVALTGDFVTALVLQQMIYWTERMNDVDSYILQEADRAKENGVAVDANLLSKGWIYKTAKELAEETLTNLSDSNMRRHLKKLVDNGWLLQRQNPKYKWDRTIQYRVDLVKISGDLQKIGYQLDGYKILVSPISKIENGDFKTEIASAELENGIGNLENRTTKTENPNEQNRKAIPETTSEITPEITSETTTTSGDGCNVEVKTGKASISEKTEKDVLQL
jgi:DNA-binding transcriptional ArsR family regulator